MNKTLIIALAMASITATAQTETATPTNAAAPVAATAAPKKHKKSAKAKIVKKDKEAPSVASAIAQSEPATPKAVANSQVTATKATGADIQATPTAEGTLNAKTTEAAAPAKKWSVNAQLYSTTDFTNTQNIQSLSTFGTSYKVLPKLSVKVAQTFETLTNGRTTSDETRALTKRSNFRTAFTDIGLGTSLGGVAGSDDIALSMTLKVMGGDAEYTTTGLYGSAYNFVETNASTQWTLNPNWSIGMFGQWRAVDSRPKWYTVDAQRKDYADGGQVPTTAFDQNYETSRNSNRFLVSPALNYAFNDRWTVYHSVAWIASFKDAEQLRRNYERIYMETGVTWTPIKNLSWTVMVDQDKAVYASPSSGVDVTGYSLYKPTESKNGPDATLDAVAYETVLAYSF